MNSFKFIFTFIILISFSLILSAQNALNPIQFTSFDKEINLNVEAYFKCELKFPVNSETIEMWNWKLFINNPDSLYTLVFEDSIQGHNESTFSFALDTIPYPSFSSTWVGEDLYQSYSGIIIVYGIDSKGKKQSLSKEVTIVGDFIQHDGNGCSCGDFIFITAGIDSVYENGEFTYSARFFDDDESGTYCEYWNWKSYYITSNGCKVIAFEDSIYGVNQSDWTLSLGNLTDDCFLGKDSLNRVLGYINVNSTDSDNYTNYTYKTIFLLDMVTGIETGKWLASSYKLYQNYPNPINPITNISFYLGNPTNVFLEIYDLSGKLIKTLVENKRVNGSFKIQWDGSNNFGKPVSSGVYIYTLKTNGFNRSKKLVLIR